mmetsp:Transcript_19598/g.63624  ORF Transcript_19598/g.63624 Transcript_19598/m.63624 type:complete len:308 (-) Transcript_19598:762-1685(-)
MNVRAVVRGVRPSIRVTPSRASRASRAGPLEAKKRNVAEKMLDVMSGGPKLRRWYGEASLDEQEEMRAEQEMMAQELEEIRLEELDGDLEKEAVMVTEGDGAIGEAVVIRLIVMEQPVRVLCKSREAAEARYGPYVTAIEGSVDDPVSVRRALNGSKSAIILGKTGCVPDLARKAGIDRMALLSCAGITRGGPGLLRSLTLPGPERTLQEPDRESTVKGLGIPYAIVRAGSPLERVPGQTKLIEMGQGDALEGSISLEDAAAVLVLALLRDTDEGGLTFEVVNGAKRDESVSMKISSQLDTFDYVSL